MERISIYDDEGIFQGWFSFNAAKQIAEYATGDLYTHGKILLVTAKGKLVVNSWNNSGYDKYRFATNEREVAEILARSDYEGNDEKLKEVLKKYEL